MRNRLMHLVKETLIQTRPSRAFTRSVMAAFGSLSMAGHGRTSCSPCFPDRRGEPKQRLKPRREWSIC